MKHSPTAHRRGAPGVRVLVAVAIAAAVLAPALPALRESRALGATAACTPDPAWPAASSALAQQVVDLENARRASLGLALLTVDMTLSDAAAWKARYMAQTGTFGHDDPPPFQRDAHTRSLVCGYTANAAWGENIAFGQSSPAAVMDAWVASVPHRTNLDNASYGAIGVGAAADSAGRIYWVQDFGSVVVAARGTSAATATAAAAASARGAASSACDAAVNARRRHPPRRPSSRARERGRADRGARSRSRAARRPPVKRTHRHRSTRLHAAKPHAGSAYTVQPDLRPRAGGDLGARGALPRAALRASASAGHGRDRRPRRDVHVADPGEGARRTARRAQ